MVEYLSKDTGMKIFRYAAVSILFFFSLCVSAEAIDFFPDAVCIDQGAAGTGCVKTFLNAVGMGKGATLVFKHSSNSNTTTYAIGTSLTIPNNVKVKVEKGAVIQVASTKTLTINGPSDAGLYQIFNCVGTGTVNFGAGAIKEASPEWWGIDGRADQAEINSAIVSVQPWHGVVRLQATNYNIDSQIFFYTGTSLLGTSTDISSGSLSTTITSTYNGYAIVSASSSAGYSARFEKFKLILDSTGRAGMGGISLDYFSSSDIKDVAVQLISGSSNRAGIRMARTDSKGGYYNRVERTLVAAVSSYHFAYGLQMGGGANQNVIDHFDARRCDTSVFLTGAHNTVTNLNSESANRYHVYIENGGGYGNHYIHAYMDEESTSTGIFNNAAIGSTLVVPHYAGLGTNFVGVDNCAIISGAIKPAALNAAYGTTIAAFDALAYGVVRIVVTNRAGFTISNPASSTAYAGLSLTFIILNSSGGPMGTITWGDEFKLGGAFTNPANGKYRLITFRRFGSYWLEESRTAADI
jgi:hypothetical protein